MAVAHSVLAVLCLFSVLGGCAEGEQIGDSAASSAQLQVLDDMGLHNLVLIHVDTLRADHMPWYGGERDTFPHLKRRPWMVVDGYTATSSWTASATASVLTGDTLAQHRVLWSDFDGIDIGGGAVNESLTLPTIADQLMTHGYATALFSGNAFVGPESGLNHGFTQTVEIPEGNRSTNAGQLVRTALEWVDVQPEGTPLFMMLQPLDPHMPYSPADEDYGTWSNAADPLVSRDLPDNEMEELYRTLIQDASLREEARQEMVDLYDEQLLGLDRSIEQLLTGLESRGLLDDTLVVFAADHGESLGDLEYEAFGHGKDYRPEVLRVPLMFLAPGLNDSHAECLSSGTDLAPTLLRAMGAPAMHNIEGAAMQDSCRETTFSSFFLPQGMLFASVRDSDEMVLANCADGSLTGYDLDADVFGGATFSAKDNTLLIERVVDGVKASESLGNLNACAELY